MFNKLRDTKINVYYHTTVENTNKIIVIEASQTNKQESKQVNRAATPFDLSFTAIKFIIRPLSSKKVE